MANTSQQAAGDCGKAGGDSCTKHNDNIAMAGYASDHWFGLVHTPISVQDAMRIPEGRAALEKEWTNLKTRNTYYLRPVREQSDVRRGATQRKPYCSFRPCVPAVSRQA